MEAGTQSVYFAAAFLKYLSSKPWSNYYNVDQNYAAERAIMGGSQFLTPEHREGLQAERELQEEKHAAGETSHTLQAWNDV